MAWKARRVGNETGLEALLLRNEASVLKSRRRLVLLHWHLQHTLAAVNGNGRRCILQCELCRAARSIEDVKKLVAVGSRRPWRGRNAPRTHMSSSRFLHHNPAYCVRVHFTRYAIPFHSQHVAVFSVMIQIIACIIRAALRR